jgi:hypothetical protein
LNVIKKRPEMAVAPGHPARGILSLHSRERDGLDEKNLLVPRKSRPRPHAADVGRPIGAYMGT